MDSSKSTLLKFNGTQKQLTDILKEYPGLFSSPTNGQIIDFVSDLPRERKELVLAAVAQPLIQRERKTQQIIRSVVPATRVTAGSSQRGDTKAKAPLGAKSAAAGTSKDVKLQSAVPKNPEVKDLTDRLEGIKKLYKKRIADLIKAYPAFKGFPLEKYNGPEAPALEVRDLAPVLDNNVVVAGDFIKLFDDRRDTLRNLAGAKQRANAREQRSLN